MEIKNCPGLLSEGFSKYSPRFLRRMFNGKKVSHILPYNAPEVDEADQKKFMQNQKRISISGVQEKYSVLLEKNNLRLTEEKEQGTYILKPKPHGLQRTSMVPVNEHLTMQIASQVYKIQTAENGIVFSSIMNPHTLQNDLISVQMDSNVEKKILHPWQVKQKKMQEKASNTIIPMRVLLNLLKNM